MRRWVGILVAAVLYYSGLVRLARWFMQRSGRRLIILNYHRASGGDLQRHLLYLRRHYRMLHLDEALEELYSPNRPPKNPHDRRTPLVLTFDDGYHDNYTHAFPLALKLQIPITIFLIPGYIESGDYFWWGEGRRLVRRATADKVTFAERTFHLQEADARSQLASVIDTHLRHATSIAEREASLAAFRRLLAVSTTVLPSEQDEQPLTWQEIRVMLQSGQVSFGAHTLHHPILACLSDPAEVRQEVAACRQVLEAHLDRPIRIFAYPIGRYEHIGPHAIQAVQEAGYAWAVTTVHAVNTPQHDPLRLGRVLGDVSRHWLVLAAETSGIWHAFAPVWKAILGAGESV